jgi:hypothetical protein
MHITLPQKAPLKQVCSFARWLPKHAQLLRSITTKVGVHSRYCTLELDGLMLDSYLDTTQVLLQSAIQLAASGTCNAAQKTLKLPDGINLANKLAAAAAAATAQPQLPGVRLMQQQQQQQRLRLVSFSTDWLGTPATISALPAHSLTHLDLAWPHSETPASEAMVAALGQLTSLRQLSMGPYQGEGSFPSSLLSAVPYMSQLTLLELAGGFESERKTQALQQLLLLPLPLQRLQISSKWLPALSYEALTQLTELSTADIYDSSKLPTQLQQLQAKVGLFARGLDAVTGLQQLQRIRLSGFASAEELLQLKQLPALQHLALQYETCSHAVAAARAWPQLQQLQELEVLYDNGHPRNPNRQQWMAIRSAVAACTGLTKLTLQAITFLEVEEGVGELDEERLFAVCASLAGLTCLRDLCIQNYTVSSWMPDDALALTALTGLTRLVLAEADDAVGDLIATALACNLRQLQHLDLQPCNLDGLVCLEAIAQLTQLTELRLEGNDGSRWTQQAGAEGLMLLTGLKQLQRLGFDVNAKTTAVSHQRLQDFWSAVRQPRA